MGEHMSPEDQTAMKGKRWKGLLKASKLKPQEKPQETAKVGWKQMKGTATMNRGTATMNRDAFRREFGSSSDNAFGHFDMNHDGSIDEVEWAKQFRRIDKNGDMQISRQEWIAEF